MVAIIGGLGSVAGPILGALWVILEMAPMGFCDLQNLTSNIGLLVLLVYFPGGLLQIVPLVMASFSEPRLVCRKRPRRLP